LTLEILGDTIMKYSATFLHLGFGRVESGDWEDLPFYKQFSTSQELEDWMFLFPIHSVFEVSKL